MVPSFPLSLSPERFVRHFRRLSSFGLTRLALTLCMALGSLLLGSPFAAATGWTTSGTKILTPSGTQYIIAGVNWYGAETTSYVPDGMWTVDYKSIATQILQYGFNTVRLPFSNQMWEQDPAASYHYTSACPDCKGKNARDILALIINYLGSLGLHVILDNHRSEAGNSAEANGLWYYVSGSNNYPESSWINDWVNVQRWVHGVKQANDTVTLNYLASDGFPIVLGYDLRNEPHTPSRTAYLQGATWGTGDGISPTTNPNPNPFAITTSTPHDWRLAAERAGDSILGDAASHGWDYPLIFVEGISQFPTATGTAANGPYDYYWWGGQLQGINGNANNPGAPVVLNSGGSASGLGAPVANQLVYSGHDYGPSEYQQPWFNTGTCYKSGCSSSSLADVWTSHWGFTNLSGGINPVWPGHSAYPWSNTGATAYSQTPTWLGEFGTGNASSDCYTSGAGSQGQWFTDLVNYVQSSYVRTTTNDSGYALSNLNWTYWSINGNDSYGVLNSNWNALAYPNKVYSFLCSIEQMSISGCGSTGPLPAPQ
ncbi:MAG TPA: cellulase family glycosylhydrolase [Chthonomonadaceae bacterium]|nr:cellulase family glycosylhydrolase [Chthonomonadaceae bacterium]